MQRDFAELIACPTCHARVIDRCRAGNGRRRKPHNNRLVSRRCLCGEVPPWGCMLCAACSKEAKRERNNAYWRRTHGVAA